MFRRTLLGMVTVLSLLAVGSGSAFADHRWSGGGGHHHHHHDGGYGYGGGQHQLHHHGGYGYGGGYGGGYGYRSVVIAPRQVIMPQSYGYGAPAYDMSGCNNGYGGASYGYGGYPSAGYGSSFGYSSPGFGLYIGR